MEKFVEKLTTYNILNNILPGVVFCYLCDRLLSVQIVDDSIAENLFVFYFIGMIISRVGSLVVEPIYMKFNLVKYAPYTEYVDACKKDDKILILLEGNNTYRTMIAVVFLLIFYKMFLFLKDMWCCFSIVSDWMIIGFFVLVFSFSYIKQTKYIRDRIKIACKGEK